MNSMDLSGFQGFTPETFRFLFEIYFNNNTEWFESNRDRYVKYVQQPMKQLAAALSPTVLSIDPEFNVKPTAVVSRIRRDTRFTRDKSPYRNHVWLGFRHPNTRISEGITLWFEITPKGYDYGVGFYSASSEFMHDYRKKLISDPAGFMQLAHMLEKECFFYSADAYKKQHFPNVLPELQPYINVKGFAWEKNHEGIADLLEPSDILDRLKREFLLLKPMYDYINSIPAANSAD